MKKVFGGNIGPQEIQIYKLVQMLLPSQNKLIEKLLIGQGMVHGEGAAQYGRFLGQLASIGVLLAIDVVSKLLGKGMQVNPPRSRW